MFEFISVNIDENTCDSKEEAIPPIDTYLSRCALQFSITCGLSPNFSCTRFWKIDYSFFYVYDYYLRITPS